VDDLTDVCIAVHAYATYHPVYAIGGIAVGAIRILPPGVPKATS